MIRLILYEYSPYGESRVPKWTETLPEGATAEQVVGFISGLVEGFNEIQKGEWEAIPVGISVINQQENFEEVLYQGVLT